MFTLKVPVLHDTKVEEAILPLHNNEQLIIEFEEVEEDYEWDERIIKLQDICEISLTKNIKRCRHDHVYPHLRCIGDKSKKIELST